LLPASIGANGDFRFNVVFSPVERGPHASTLDLGPRDARRSNWRAQPPAQRSRMRSSRAAQRRPCPRGPS
jgi:hypothetical protein